MSAERFEYNVVTLWRAGTNNAIEILDLSWNQMRKTAAVLICSGLKVSVCLSVYLSMSVCLSVFLFVCFFVSVCTWLIRLHTSDNTSPLFYRQ